MARPHSISGPFPKIALCSAFGLLVCSAANALSRATETTPVAPAKSTLVAGAARPFEGSMDKAFFVSPFIGGHGRYAVTVRDEPDGIRLAIALRQDGEHLLSTSLVLRRRPLTDLTLARMVVRHPLMTHRTIGLIHWHALRLWLRGAPFFSHHATPGDAARAAQLPQEVVR